MKRILALLLSLLVVIAAVPVGVLSVAAATSGTTGDCTWLLDGTALTISGSGAMADYTSSSAAPWGYAIKTVTIAEGVTHIGGKAFYNCTALKEATIPTTVTSIGSDAFYYCSSLADVYISDIVSWCAIDFVSYASNPLYYGRRLVLNGTQVTHLVLPDEVTVISARAFFGCNSLQTVTIPATTTTIGAYAFRLCSVLTAITVDESNPNYCDVDGVLFNKDKTTLIQYPASKSGNYTIPTGVTAIGDYAFHYMRATSSVTIPGTVETIGTYAFWESASLTSVVVEDGVTAIGNYAFAVCSYLSAISLPDSIRTIGFDAFANTAYYNDATNWEDGLVLYIGNHLIQAKTTISGTYTIRAGTVTVRGSAFEDCSSLTAVTVPDSVVSMGRYVFADCPALTQVTLSSQLTAIPDYTFNRCSSLTTVRIPDGVESIGQHAFRNCSSLTAIHIPYSVTQIMYSAFYGCTALGRIVYAGTEEERLSVTVGNGNTPLSQAQWEYHQHVYATVCDADCDDCGRMRADAHLYADACDSTCNVCGAVRDPLHAYDTACDGECNLCGQTRETAHVYDHACDTVCNVCAQVRQITHTYDNGCDATCNVCGLERSVEPHRYADAADTTCDECGYARVVCLIYTVEDLYTFAALVNGGKTDCSATLMQDITVNENVLLNGSLNTAAAATFRSWTPIATKENPFVGAFSGNGHTIRGLYAQAEDTETFGFFAYNAGTVTDLHLADLYFCLSGEEDDYGKMGGICAYNVGGVISDCSVAGWIEYNGGRYGASSLGGICANNAGKLSHCHSDVYIDSYGGSRGDSYGGGICAHNENAGVIEYCYNSGTVYVHASTGGDNSVWSRAGGIAVYNYGVIRYSFNAGEVKGTAGGGHEDAVSVWVGGVVAHNNGGGEVDRCFNVGGLIGRTSSSANEAFTSARTTVGGIAATQETTAAIKESKSLGEISATATTSGAYYEILQDEVCPTSGGTTTVSDYGSDEFYDGTLCALLTYHAVSRCQCLLCGDISHAYADEVTVVPTCTQEGVRMYTCACGDSYTEAIPSFGGHIYDHACDVDCNTCGAVREVDPHPYDIVASTVATCTQDGATIYACGVCGDSYTVSSPAWGHTQVTVPGYAPTCTTPGLSDAVFCSVCGEVSAVQETILPLGHTVVILPAVPPTCTDSGLTGGSSCLVCGVTLVAQTDIPAVGHAYDDAYDTICNVCGDSHTVVGDLNMDGKINNRDLVLMLRYLNDWAVTLDVAAADTNGDGLVNNRDVVWIQRYLNGWHVSLS